MNNKYWFKPINENALLQSAKSLNKNFTYEWIYDNEIHVKMKEGFIGTLIIIGMFNLGWDAIAFKRVNKISYPWIRFKKRDDGKTGEFKN